MLDTTWRLQMPGRLFYQLSLLFLVSGALFTGKPALARPTLQPTALQEQSKPVIIHWASQEFPAVDGSRVVWQDARFGATDIFLRDLTNNTPPVNLTQSNSWEVQPAIDGDLVVWKDGYVGVGIHGLNLTSQTIFTVTAGQRDTSRPQLSNGVVVWADNRAGDQNWNIYGYDIAHATELVISNAPGNQRDPQIDWPWVVWWDDQERIYLYNLTTQQQQTVLATRGARLPDVSAADGLVIWQDARNGNWDLYGYDLGQQQEIALLIAPRDQEKAVIDHGVITYQERTEGSAWNIALFDLARKANFLVEAQAANQTEVALSQKLVVWQDIRNHTADIFAWQWQGEVPVAGAYTVAAPAELQAGALLEGEVLLQWKDNATTEDGFVLERAQGITGTTWSELASLPANQTIYRDQPSQRAESYWYRLRAQRAGDFSGYSNESFATTFANTPNLYELYLMTLINAARADPAAFGYPDYLPVPPLAYNPLVGYSAHSHSQAILNSGYQFGHCDLIGRCSTERAQAVGYGYNCGENLTATFRTGPAAIAEANQGFLDSEPHRNNRLAADLTEMGVGHTFDPDKGDSGRHGQITEVFCGNPTVKPPTLPVGAIYPYIGTTVTDFTYLVNFYTADGKAPTKAQVVIDGVAHAMSLRWGRAGHGTYQYVQQLPAGEEHTFYFAFTLSNGPPVRWPDTGVIPYPHVAAPANLPPVDPPAPPRSFLHLFYLAYVRR
ncbi:MAG: CAP domain-containing protein [Caldilineaceae bacterium]